MFVITNGFLPRKFVTLMLQHYGQIDQTLSLHFVLRSASAADRQHLLPVCMPVNVPHLDFTVD